MPDATSFKQQAAELAAGEIRSGMIVGLGTGSTAIYATRRLGELIRQGTLSGIRAIATSEKTEDEAKALGIELLPDDACADVDLTIDGADEIDPDLNVIKGGGGALLREKIVAQMSRRLIIVADDSKLSPRLGTRFYVPVEVIPFAWRSQAAFLIGLGASAALRQSDGAPFVTDNGNYILDCRFGPIADANALAGALSERAGVVEHGLFLGMASEAILAGESGVRRLTRG